MSKKSIINPVSPTVIKKVLETVDAGLVCGIGEPIPGRMCVEAAVCYALGEPHGDTPYCVHPVLRSLKIALNDSLNWSTNEARAKGLRKLAVLQLGTDSCGFNVNLFLEKLVELARIMAATSYADSAAARYASAAARADHASYAAFYAARAARYAARAAAAAGADAANKIFFDFSEAVSQILIEMKVPAVKYLDLLK